MSTIAGLPAHALLVHAIVVLAPLTALALILDGLWPAARRRLVWPTLALAVATVILTPLTTSAGEWLYDRTSEHPPILEAHAERADTMLYVAIALLVVAVLQAGQHWWESHRPNPPRLAAAALAALSVAVGVVTVVDVVRIGDSGARAVWADES